MPVILEYLANIATQVIAKIELLLPEELAKRDVLRSAMRYSAISTGKMLRPALVMAVAGSFAGTSRSALNVATALELAHVYSLIHDDLPAMDNDDMRRGKPSCHKAFSESVALLAGNALLTLAFSLLADEKPVLLKLMAQAMGVDGVMGGQMMDLNSENYTLVLAEVTKLHAMKTASLFAFAAEAGAIVAGANGEDCFKMREYGLHLGHAFQIIDDILDVEGEEELVGKKLRKDSAIGKATYLNLMSVAEAYKYAQMHIEQAKDASANKVRLHELAEFILIRKK